MTSSACKISRLCLRVGGLTYKGFWPVKEIHLRVTSPVPQVIPPRAGGLSGMELAGSASVLDSAHMKTYGTMISLVPPHVRPLLIGPCS